MRSASIQLLRGGKNCTSSQPRTQDVLDNRNPMSFRVIQCLPRLGVYTYFGPWIFSFDMRLHPCLKSQTRGTCHRPLTWNPSKPFRYHIQTKGPYLKPQPTEEFKKATAQNRSPNVELAPSKPFGVAVQRRSYGGAQAWAPYWDSAKPMLTP